MTNEKVEIKEDKPIKYEPDDLVVGKSLKPGEELKATISAIKTGKLRDFISEDKLKLFKSKPDDAFIEVTCVTDVGISKSKLMSCPQDKVVSPKSHLARWKRVYGGFPKVGQEVTMIVTDEGYLDFKI